MIGSKEIIIDDTYITFTNIKKKFKVKDIDKYEKDLSGKLRILLTNTRMEVINVDLEKYESVEKIIGENFYNPKDKLFHYIKDKKSKDLTLYSIDKPIILDRLMENGRITSIKPYEFLLLRKYKSRKKNIKRIVIHSEFDRIFLLAIERNKLVYSKNISINESKDLGIYIKFLKEKIAKEKDEEIDLDFGNNTEDLISNYNNYVRGEAKI